MRVQTTCNWVSWGGSQGVPNIELLSFSGSLRSHEPYAPRTFSPVTNKSPKTVKAHTEVGLLLPRGLGNKFSGNPWERTASMRSWKRAAEHSRIYIATKLKPFRLDR
jgi:hypothetical protein